MQRREVSKIRARILAQTVVLPFQEAGEKLEDVLKERQAWAKDHWYAVIQTDTLRRFGDWEIESPGNLL